MTDRAQLLQRIEARAVQAWGVYLAILLFGYMVEDKGFAYLGLAPLYVGEIGLILGLAIIGLQIWRGSLQWERLKSPEVVILLVFMLWNLLRTVPYISKDGILALRDAVVWGYALFALLVLVLTDSRMLSSFVRWYARLIPVALIWWIVAYCLLWFLNIHGNPLNPAFPFFLIKSGDIAVHLTGFAAFMLLDLGAPFGVRFSRTGTVVIWVLWWVNWLLAGVISRAAMINPLIGLGILFLFSFRDLRRWLAPALSGAALIVVLFLSGVHIVIPDSTRSVSISFDQIAANLVSMKSSSDAGATGVAYYSTRRIPLTRTRGPTRTRTPTGTRAPTRTAVTRGPGTGTPVRRRTPTPTHAPTGTQSLATLPGPVPGSSGGPPGTDIAGSNTTPAVDLREETIAWRLAWWSKIINYTLYGPYFWGGKGYGINLADDDGFEDPHDPTHSLRNPHNVFMTYLARGGVPGLALWLLFLAVVFWNLLVSGLMRGRIDLDSRPLAAGLLVYLTASLFNASFDVYLEGPMGGVWFWCLIGLVLILLGQPLAPGDGDSPNAGSGSPPGSS